GEQLAAMMASPVASVYVLEGGEELVLRGTFGFTREAIGEVRMKVGQGITGTCVETMSPVTVDDARMTAQFEYFPQLAEERYPAFLAIPLLSASRPRGALVLQRESGPFSEGDILLAIGATRALTALVDSQNPAGAHVILRGEGSGRRSTSPATFLLRWPWSASRQRSRGRWPSTGQRRGAAWTSRHSSVRSHGASPESTPSACAEVS